MKGKSKITQKDFDFIIKNRGKLTQNEMAKMFGVHWNYISRMQLRYLRFGIRTVQEFKNSVNNEQRDSYTAKQQEAKERSWETQVDEGMEIYHFVVRRRKLPRKMVYQRLRKDFEEIQRMKKAA